MTEQDIDNTLYAVTLLMCLLCWRAARRRRFRPGHPDPDKYPEPASRTFDIDWEAMRRDDKYRKIVEKRLPKP